MRFLNNTHAMCTAKLITFFGVMIVVLMFTGMDTRAQTKKDKFALIESSERNQVFSFADSSLLFESVSPEEVQWHKADEPANDLNEAQVVEGFRLKYRGYDPLNRDLFEISIYTADIIPNRVMPAPAYGAMLASKWASENYGGRPRTRDFGEVLGGDKSTGQHLVNRISVLRRGGKLLVIRSKFDADHYERYADDIARFLGSIAFAETQIEDVIESQLIHRTLMASKRTFEFDVPGTWELFKEQSNPQQGQLEIWLDAADETRSSAVLFAAVPPQGEVPEGARPAIDDQKAANLAGDFVKLMVENLLPETAVRLTPLGKNDFPDLLENAYFASNFSFKVLIGEGSDAKQASALQHFSFFSMIVRQSARPS